MLAVIQRAPKHLVYKVEAEREIDWHARRMGAQLPDAARMVEMLEVAGCDEEGEETE